VDSNKIAWAFAALLRPPKLRGTPARSMSDHYGMGMILEIF
jgi:hypothetical protein